MIQNNGNLMLIDVQYIKPNRKMNQPDYLYIIYKDIDTGEKHLEIIPEPKTEIWFTKPEKRNHAYNKNYERVENLDKVVVKYKDIIYAIADNIGPNGQAMLRSCFETRDYDRIQEFYIYPYVYGADFDIRVYYRYQWSLKFDNDKEKKLSKGFLDIEVDTMEAIGMPNPVVNPIDLITLIDVDKKESYTFSLIGVKYQKPLNNELSVKELEYEKTKEAMYNKRLERQFYYAEHIDELTEEAHKMFDENYPDMKYNFYFYTDERKMLVHIFQLINKLKLDFIGVWNISFDIPYIINRLESLGMNPADVMCHPDFPVKECYFKKDKRNFEIKKKSDFFHVSSYTVFTDQMINYAAIRKGASELRSNRLTYIAEREINDEKLDYSEDGNIKTLSYNNYLKYVLYNIKDVLLQVGIENRTSDIETYYMTSYANITPYENEFKQTVKLRNVAYSSYLSQGLVIGENVNGVLYNQKQNAKTINKSSEDDDENEEEDGFEGALVGDPTLIDNFGVKLFGKPTNSIFDYSIDFDMSAFYPSSIRTNNIDPSTLIFKMIMKSNQYDVRGGKIPFKGITDTQINRNNDDSFGDDISKEFMDNIQTGNYLYTSYKWLNLPSINEMYEIIKRKI